MRVTPPVPLVDVNFVSSTAAEPTAPATYAGGTMYALGDIVKVVADFAIYESLQNTNSNNTPNVSPLWWRQIGPTEIAYDVGYAYSIGDTCYSAATHHCYEALAAGTGNPLPVLPETKTTKWLDIGPTNRWAMLDGSRNTQTVQASPMTVVIAPGQRINTVGITGIKGNTVIIKATSVNGGGTVYPLAYDATKTYAKNECMTVGFATCYQSLADGNVGHAAPDAAWWQVVTGAVFDLRKRLVYDGYMYFFEPFTTGISKVVFDVPPYSDIIVTITITDTSGNVKCGSVVFGTYVYLGKIQYHSKSDGLNFSTITRDAWGTATLVPHRTVPKLNCTTDLDSSYVTKAMDTRVALNAVPALWTGLDDSTSDWFEMVEILGIYKQFELEAMIQDHATLTLEVEEI